MVTAATGNESLLLENWENIIANSSTFQAWVGEITAAPAKNHIYLFQSAPTDVRPLAIIGFEEEPSGDAIAGGTRIIFDLKAAMWVEFQADIVDTDSPKDSYFEFTNETGGIVEDIQLLAGTGTPLEDGGGALNITNIGRKGIGRANIKRKVKEGEFYAAQYVARVWGRGA